MPPPLLHHLSPSISETLSLSQHESPGTMPGGSGTNLPKAVLIIATVSSALATLLSLLTVWLQLKNYRKIALQRLVVRILVMVPIYSLSSLISLYSLDLAFFLDAVRDIYEAFVIYCFFNLLVEYLGGERSLIILLHGRPPINHPFPLSLCLPPLDVSDPFTFLAIKRGILQYVQIKPVLAVITIMLKALGSYGDGNLSKSSGYTYVSIVYNVSVGLSLYCLALFWIATNEDLRPYRPMPKFLCVKGIIFFSFWQGFAVSVLVALGWVRSHTLVCLEMPIFSFLHLYAFSYTDYIDSNHLYSGRLPVWYAVRDAFGYKDIFTDSLTTVKGTGFSYRTFEPAAGGIHVGRGRDRRVAAGLRYAQGGKVKYWVDLPGEETDAYGRKGTSSIIARPIHAMKKALEDRLDVNEGYAPLTDEEAREVVHRDRQDDAASRYEPEDWKRWRHEEGRNEDGIESDEESLGFGEVENEDEDEGLYEDAKTLEFGDWSYPVVDASKEEARRRMRLQEEARVDPSRRPRKNGKGKGKERSQPQKTFSYGGLVEGEEGGAARVLGISESPPSSSNEVHRHEQPTSADHPRPEGELLIHGAKHVLHTVSGGLYHDPDDEDEEERRRRKQPEPRRLPSGAYDLVVEDREAEEEEQIKDRRKGEPGGKKKRVYRQIYRPEGEEEVSSTQIETPTSPTSKQVVEVKKNETGQVDGTGEGNESGGSTIVVKEVEITATAVDARPSSPWS